MKTRLNKKDFYFTKNEEGIKVCHDGYVIVMIKHNQKEIIIFPSGFHSKLKNYNLICETGCNVRSMSN